MVDQPTQPPESARRYAAFISYSQKDGAVAAWLHRKLERFAIPAGIAPDRGVKTRFGRRIGKVFRDREEFTAGREINDQIQEALASAEAIIVLCSPNAVASPYVSNEVKSFRELGRGKIIPVIVGGEPPDCFPDSLRDGADILGADFREGKDGRDAGFIKIVAGLLDVPADALFQRERRRQRVLMAQFGAAAVAFAGLAVAAGVLGVLAQRNALIAEERAATLSIDAARTLSAEGDTHGALLMLLDAARVLGRGDRPAPDALLIAFDEALRRAGVESELPLPAGAELFPIDGGALVVSPEGQVSLLNKDAALVLVGEAGGPVAFAAQSEPGGPIVAVRADGAVLTLDASGARELGRLPLAPGQRLEPGSLDRGEYALQDGLLTTRTDAENGAAVLVFDMRTQQAARVETEHWMPSVVRGVEGGLQAYSLVWEEGPGLFAQACGLDPAGAAMAWVVETGAQNGVCRRLGEARFITVWNYGSGGEFRSDVFVGAGEIMSELGVFDGSELDEQVRALDQIVASFALGNDDYLIRRIEGEYAGVDRSWVGLDPATATLAIASDRNLLLKATARQIQEYRFPAPIRFGTFLADGRVAVVLDGLDRVHIIDPAASEQYGVVGPLAEEDTRNVFDGSAGADGVCVWPGQEAEARARLAYPFEVVQEGEETTLVFAASGNARPVPLSVESCVMVSPDGTKAIVPGFDTAIVYDLAMLDRDGPERARVAVLPFKARQFATWTLGGTAVLASDGLSLDLARLPETYDGSPVPVERIYQGDRVIQMGALDPTGTKLLVREDLGGGDVGGLVYSLEARQVWRRLGQGYKWFAAWWRPDGTIAVNNVDIPSVVLRLHTLPEAVAAAQEALDARCRDFTGTDYRRSSCWPAALR